MQRHVEKYCPIVKERLARCENERRKARVEQLRAENCVGEQLLEKFVALEDKFAAFKASTEEFKASMEMRLASTEEFAAFKARTEELLAMTEEFGAFKASTEELKASARKHFTALQDIIERAFVTASRSGGSGAH
jgi:hypothetical protein